MEQHCVSPADSDITYRFSHDNLHIRLSGHFEQPQAETVINLLKSNQQICKKIFIDVRCVSRPHPSAVDALKRSLLLGQISGEQIIFKGKSGFDMAVSGNRVLIEPEKKHICRGNCANCRCRRHKHEQPH